MSDNDLRGALGGLQRALRTLSRDECNVVAREVAEVLHSAPPGVGKVAFLRGLIARNEAGTATYEDRIIMDACSRPDVLKLVAEMFSGSASSGL
jgi:hypothetical protein